MKYTLRRGLKYGFIASTIILVILFFGPQIGNYLPDIAKWTYYPLRDVVNFFGSISTAMGDGRFRSPSFFYWGIFGASLSGLLLGVALSFLISIFPKFPPK